MKTTLLFASFLLVFASSGCRYDLNEGRSASNDLPDAQENPSTEDRLTNAYGEEKPARIDTVQFYLENSSSMGGYFLSPTRFFGNIDKLLVSLSMPNFFGNKIKPHTIGEEIETYPSVERFREAFNPFNDTRLEIANSSPLDKILGTILERSQSNDISILVTDGIMSGTNEQLVEYDDPKRGKYFNKDLTEHILESQIISELSHYTEKFAMKVMAFKSDFVSTRKYPYYKLDNNKTDRKPIIGTFENRPYYLIIFGRPALITTFITKCQDILDPLETLEFGFDYNSPDRFRLTHLYRKKRNCQVTIGKDQLEVDENQLRLDYRLDFGVLIKAPFLEGATSKQLDEFSDRILIYLNGNLVDEFQINIDQADNDELLFLSKRTLKYWKGYTHIISVSLRNESVVGGDQIDLRIINDLPGWYREWSSEDDLEITLDDERTFAFQNFIGGIATAYKGGQEYELQAEFPISVVAEQ